MNSRVVRVKRVDFRKMLSAEHDLGEIIMRALILRRVGLIRHAQGGIVLIGSSHAADALRLQRFLTRNGYPHRWIDTVIDADAEGLLKRHQVQPGAGPIVIAPGEDVLLNPSNATLADHLRSHRDV